MLAAVLLSTWGTIALQPKRKFGPDWQQALLSRTFDVLLGVWFFVVGSSIGSFLNVVAYRLPRGMSINGFSRCPYCYTNIRGSDNIPLIGWIRLRGRCRACRLPISARYPGFELLGGGVAMILFLFEFLSHCSNLPLTNRPVETFGMLAGRMDWDSLARTLWHLTLLYVLIAAAMIRWGGQTAPKRLFAVGIIAWLIGALAWPDFYPLAWRSPLGDSTSIVGRLNPLFTWVVGGVWGICLASLILPISWRFITDCSGPRALDRKRIDAWLGAWFLVGVALGWQSMLPVGLLCVGTCLFVWAIRSMRGVQQPFDPLAWLWLAVLLHLITWSNSPFESISWWPGEKKPWWVLLGSVAVIVFGFGIVGRVVAATSPTTTQPQLTPPPDERNC